MFDFLCKLFSLLFCFDLNVRLKVALLRLNRQRADAIMEDNELSLEEAIAASERRTAKRRARVRVYGLLAAIHLRRNRAISAASGICKAWINLQYWTDRKSVV